MTVSCEGQDTILNHAHTTWDALHLHNGRLVKEIWWSSGMEMISDHTYKTLFVSHSHKEVFYQNGCRNLLVLCFAMGWAWLLTTPKTHPRKSLAFSARVKCSMGVTLQLVDFNMEFKPRLVSTNLHFPIL